MQHSRRRRRTALIAGMTLAGAAAFTGVSTAGATAGSSGGGDSAGGASGGGTIESAPTCTGESDGVLNFASVLPETGSLAFLGPPMSAAVQLAQQDINAAGGVLGKDVGLTMGDSGDTSTDIATRTVADGLAAGADVFIGSASSGVTSTFIDTLVEACKVEFSPANTSDAFTTYDDNGLYFRTASLQVAAGRGALRPQRRRRRQPDPRSDRPQRLVRHRSGEVRHGGLRRPPAARGRRGAHVQHG